MIDGTLALRDTVRRDGEQLQGCERLIVSGSGVDEITARELALKVEEGMHVPVTPLGIEKVLHGHLPAADPRTGIVVIRVDPANAPRATSAANDVEAAAKELGMPAVTIDGLPGATRCSRARSRSSC